MKRDFDLIRRILIEVENKPAGETIPEIRYPEYDGRTVDEHIYLLHEAGLLKLQIISGMAGHKQYEIIDLTWPGHDLLDAMKDDNLWIKAKEQVLKPGASFTFGLLLQWLEVKAKEKLGLP
jgi:hypothetical protein